MNDSLMKHVFYKSDLFRLAYVSAARLRYYIGFSHANKLVVSNLINTNSGV